MERMLAVVFDNDSKAYEGTRALNRLNEEDSISIHAIAVVKKNPDGSVITEKQEGDYPLRSLVGTGLGALIGLIGGPAGAAMGAAAGASVGILSDLSVAGINAGFLDEVRTALLPGKCAVVAEINEGWVTPVNSSMEELGGTIFRAERRHVEADELAADRAEINREIDQLEAEQARSSAEAKAKLQAKIDQLNAKLKDKLEKAKQRFAQTREERKAKIEALKKRAGAARADRKAALNARIDEIRQHYEQSDEKMKAAVAGKLREEADRLEKAG